MNDEHLDAGEARLNGHRPSVTTLKSLSKQRLLKRAEAFARQGGLVARCRNAQIPDDTTQPESAPTAASAPDKPQRVAICICTCQRPKMLARCLDSVISQIHPAWIKPAIIVVDNDPEKSAEPVVQLAMVQTGANIHYRHQATRGIAFARNSALEWSYILNADWVAFIDDDEWAEPDWLANLMHPDYLDTPVLMGWRQFVYPEPRPFWTVDRFKRPEEGKALKTAQTNNIRFSITIVAGGFTFDESLGLMGGEDNEFFYEVNRAGFAIRQTARAVTFETAHPERCTLRGQLARNYWYGVSNMRRHAIDRGWPRATAMKAPTVPLLIAAGLIEMAVSPAFLIGGQHRFKRRFLAGGKKIVKAAGRTAAMLGILPQPYRRIVGC